MSESAAAYATLIFLRTGRLYIYGFHGNNASVSPSNVTLTLRGSGYEYREVFEKPKISTGYLIGPIKKVVVAF